MLTNIVPTMIRQQKVAEHMNSGTRKRFSTLNCNVFHHLQYSPNMATNNLLLFHPLQDFMAEKVLIDAQEVKTCLTYCFELYKL